MEAYKGDAAVSIFKSLQILADFPDQVVMLKGTKEIGGLDAVAPGIAERMIVPANVHRFSETSLALKQAHRGDCEVLQAIQEHEKAAKQHMDRILVDAGELTPALKDIESLFTSSEIKAIRTEYPYSLNVINKTLIAANQLYHNFRLSHPSKLKSIARKRRWNSFLFRFSLASVIYVITWMRQGSAENRKPERVRNDLVDLNFATFGTYFNGLMTGDHRLQETHAELRAVLDALGARMKASYNPTEFLLFGAVI